MLWNTYLDNKLFSPQSSTKENGLSSGNPLDLYSGSTRFECLSVYWLRFLLVFLSAFSVTPGPPASKSVHYHNTITVSFDST
jgi:hypothetical protein